MRLLIALLLTLNLTVAMSQSIVEIEPNTPIKLLVSINVDKVSDVSGELEFKFDHKFKLNKKWIKRSSVSFTEPGEEFFEINVPGVDALEYILNYEDNADDYTKYSITVEAFQNDEKVSESFTVSPDSDCLDTSGPNSIYGKCNENPQIIPTKEGSERPGN